jgi:methylthioribose-1-phosphate isomerase
MSAHRHDTVRALVWEDDALRLLDQRRLPAEESWITLRDAPGVAAAIRDMVVRGAPAIGVAAAYGVVLAAREAYARAPGAWQVFVEEDLARLAAARPTAVNLFWALARMRRAMAALAGDPVPALLAEAHAVLAEDVAANRRVGELGAALFDRAGAVLTHCNTGSLATGGYGTALGVIRSAAALGKVTRVYADETRPWLQGARLTAWELVRDGIPVDLVVEGAAASLLRLGEVRWVVVGADRVAANGDFANKIGTYGLAVLARHHGVPFMVAAPTSTVDLDVPDGSAIPIEARSPDEVLGCGGRRVAAEGAGAWNPAFDVTPAGLVDALVTERGVVPRPDRGKIAALMNGVA